MVGVAHLPRPLTVPRPPPAICQITRRPGSRPTQGAQRRLAVAASDLHKEAVVVASNQLCEAGGKPESGELLKLWRWEDDEDALLVYGLFFSTLLAGAQPAVQLWAWADLPYFVALASTTIYIGAHRGLNAKQQQISLKQGALAPILASVSLFSIYLVIKYMPDLDLQHILDAYFWLLGTVAVAGGLAGPARTLGKKLGLPSWRAELPPWLLQDEGGQPPTRGEVALTDVLVVALGVGLASLDVASHHLNYTVNNLIGCMIAADILQLVGLRSFRVAAVLLLGMLAYDWFWVFESSKAVGENVMLQVATSNVISGPMRLLFPRFPTSLGEATGFPFSLLGLGDVAIPGLLACLALRYDSSRVVDLPGRAAAAVEAIVEAMRELGESEPGASGRRMGDVASDVAHRAYDEIADRELEQRARTLGTSTSGTSTTYPASPALLLHRRYFFPVLGAYVVGLLMAFAANAITHQGQPALIYLVPCTLGAVAAVAASRGELPRVLRFTDTTGEPASGEQQQEQQQ